jgi:hypothetical protein
MNCQQRVAITIVVLVALGGTAGARVIERHMERVLVQHVERNSEAEKAGLMKGDLLIYWSRVGDRGEIRSPFDVSWIELEQSPRGTVTLHGFRRSGKRDWVMGPDRWGLSVGLDFPGSRTSIYRDAEHFAIAAKTMPASDVWKEPTSQGQQLRSSWLEAWLIFREAESFAKVRQWRPADHRYELSIQQAAGAGPRVTAQIFRAWASTYRRRRDWILG